MKFLKRRAPAEERTLDEEPNPKRKKTKTGIVEGEISAYFARRIFPLIERDPNRPSETDTAGRSENVVNRCGMKADQCIFAPSINRTTELSDPGDQVRNSRDIRSCDGLRSPRALAAYHAPSGSQRQGSSRMSPQESKRPAARGECADSPIRWLPSAGHSIGTERAANITEQFSMPFEAQVAEPIDRAYSGGPSLAVRELQHSPVSVSVSQITGYVRRCMPQRTSYGVGPPLERPREALHIQHAQSRIEPVPRQHHPQASLTGRPVDAFDRDRRWHDWQTHKQNPVASFSDQKSQSNRPSPWWWLGQSVPVFASQISRPISQAPEWISAQALAQAAAPITRPVPDPFPDLYTLQATRRPYPVPERENALPHVLSTAVDDRLNLEIYSLGGEDPQARHTNLYSQQAGFANQFASASGAEADRSLQSGRRAPEELDGSYQQESFMHKGLGPASDWDGQRPEGDWACRVPHAEFWLANRLY